MTYIMRPSLELTEVYLYRQAIDFRKSSPATIKPSDHRVLRWKSSVKSCGYYTRFHLKNNDIFLKKQTHNADFYGLSSR